MIRRTIPILSSGLPRGVWDPKQHNHKHIDSYAKAISDRRNWPAKRWSVGLEPRVMDDWGQFSLRNLAYAYNGKLRACSNFPEMVPLYQEMKMRGVKVDTDTLNVLLSRGARFSQLKTEDFFLLFDELLSLGARPDLAVVEIMHTVLEQAFQLDPRWRETRRCQLIDLYDNLCREEIERLGTEGLMDLCAQEFHHYHKNVTSLKGKISVCTWQRYIAHMDSAERLFSELATFLKSYVPIESASDFPVTEIRYINNVQVPQLYKVAALLQRPDSSVNVNREQFAHDLDINEVFLSAAWRIVDAPLATRLSRGDETALMLLLEKFVRETGVLCTSDLLAQMMDVCKYCPTWDMERPAMRLYQCSYFGSAVKDSPMREIWVSEVEMTLDGRVVGRYLASRNPWGTLKYHMSGGGRFEEFGVMLREGSGEERMGLHNAEVSLSRRGKGLLSEEALAEEAAEARQKGDGDEDGGNSKDSSNGEKSQSSSNSSRATVVYSSASVYERWGSVKAVVERSGVLPSLSQETDTNNNSRPNQRYDNVAQTKLFSSLSRSQQADSISEVYNGMFIFLRNMFLEERYPFTEEYLRLNGAPNIDPAAHNRRAGRRVGDVAISRNMTLEACDAIFSILADVKRQMDMEIIQFNNNNTSSKFVDNTSGNAASDAATSSTSVQLEPELEGWESMLVVLKNMLDFLLAKREYESEAGKAVIEDLFARVSELRNEILQESREKYNGRFRVLWLQEV
eukprot:Tbor_TRINITY_DN5862_c0_g1::TRINITY_DN5862_c0_g1_i1::g.7010::m.7010